MFFQMRLYAERRFSPWLVTIRDEDAGSRITGNRAPLGF